MRKIFIPILLTSLLFASCSDPKTTLREKIEALALSETLSVDTKTELAALQVKYIDQFPEDSVTQTYHENVAMYYINIDSNDLAQQYALQYIEKFPASENLQSMQLVVAKALYNKGDLKGAINSFEHLQNSTNLPVGDTRLLAKAHLTLAQDSTADNRDHHYYKYAALSEQVDGLGASIDNYAYFIETFPNSILTPGAMMVYADKLERNKELDKAKSVYAKVIALYPESPQYNTAKTMIDQDLVGLTADQQLDKILKAKAGN
jgi:tetratricopeptide (TPR) repeat protein